MRFTCSIGLVDRTTPFQGVDDRVSTDIEYEVGAVMLYRLGPLEAQPTSHAPMVYG